MDPGIFSRECTELFPCHRDHDESHPPPEYSSNTKPIVSPIFTPIKAAENESFILTKIQYPRPALHELPYRALLG
jgi:hypothetical protein